MSNIVTLKANSAKAEKKLAMYGNRWVVAGRVEEKECDLYFFKAKDDYLYLVPVPKRVRDPEVDIGKNFFPIGEPARLGAMWISEKNDPKYRIVEEQAA